MNVFLQTQKRAWRGGHPPDESSYSKHGGGRVVPSRPRQVEKISPILRFFTLLLYRDRSGSHDLQQMFGDVKFVCMGGTPQRMKSFAEYMLSQLGYLLPTGTCLQDISERSHRQV